MSIFPNYLQNVQSLTDCPLGLSQSFSCSAQPVGKCWNQIYIFSDCPRHMLKCYMCRAKPYSRNTIFVRCEKKIAIELSMTILVCSRTYMRVSSGWQREIESSTRDSPSDSSHCARAWVPLSAEAHKTCSTTDHPTKTSHATETQVFIFVRKMIK